MADKSPLVRLQAAIDKLVALKGDSKPWVLAGGNEWISPLGIAVAPDDGGVSVREAELIVTLHRTVDAQLAILRTVVEISEFVGLGLKGERIQIIQNAIDLADAVLGDD